jgi:hypothetical protein
MSTRSTFTEEFRKDMAATFIQDNKGDLVSVTLGKTRVILITRRYGIEKFNPVWGTKCADVGTVVRISKGSGNISVDWDNCSMSMLYIPKDLQIYKEMSSNNPNVSFRAHRRKDL